MMFEVMFIKHDLNYLKTQKKRKKKEFIFLEKNIESNFSKIKNKI